MANSARRQGLLLYIRRGLDTLERGTDAPVQKALDLQQAVNALFAVVLEETTLERAQETGEFDPRF